MSAKSCPREQKHRELSKGERCPVCNHPSDADMYEALGQGAPLHTPRNTHDSGNEPLTP